MQKVSLLMTFALAASFAAQADTVHFPPRRPGLWQNTIQSPRGTFSSTSCTSAATDQAMMGHGADMMKRMGGTMTTSGSGNKFHVTSVMKVNGRTITTNEDVVFTADTAIHSQSTTHIDPPFPQGGPPNDTVTENDGKWLGPCPPDMEPGDVMTNGHKINILRNQPPPPAQ